MTDTCWYNSKKMRMDDGCNNNFDDPSKDTEQWSISGNTSLVEPEILEDMGVSMLADEEGSRESLKSLQTQECTISPTNFEGKRRVNNDTFEETDKFKTACSDADNTEKLTSFESEYLNNFSSIDNESGYISRADAENFSEHKQSFSKCNSNNAVEKETPADSFYLFRRKKKPSVVGEDKFSKLSDEMILMILKWLPKKCLVRSMLVCKRWCQIARDEALWTRLDLGSKVLNKGTLGHILPRGVQILRLAQTEINHPAFLPNDSYIESYKSKLQYLDLSMAVVTPEDLADLLSKCKCLKKLSLEKCTLNKACCKAIGENPNLEVLNLTMCEGMNNVECIKYIVKLERLHSLNLSWCSLDADAVMHFCNTAPTSITRLNIAGCRKTLTDDDTKNLLQRCTRLVELDLSDCTMITINTVHSVMKLTELEHLSLSRCYNIHAAIYMRLASMARLRCLDIFGSMTEDVLQTVQANCKDVEINKYIFSSVARPTVGVRRTSIWGLRVRD